MGKRRAGVCVATTKDKDSKPRALDFTGRYTKGLRCGVSVRCDAPGDGSYGCRSNPQYERGSSERAAWVPLQVQVSRRSICSWWSLESRGVTGRMFHFGQCFPILRSDATGKKRVVQPFSFESALQWNVTMTEIGQSCKALFDHTLALVPEKVLPEFGRNQRISSLYLQGGKKFVCGWSRRPSFPHQRKVATTIQRMVLSCSEVPLLKQTPFFVSQMTRDFVSNVTWDICYKNACSAMKRVRSA